MHYMYVAMRYYKRGRLTLLSPACTQLLSDDVHARMCNAKEGVVDARRMRMRVTIITLVCVCVSVTNLTPEYDIRVTKRTYQTGLR